MTAIIIVLVIVVLLGLYAMGVYNGLVRKRQNVRESWSAIDTELKRRYDLIPNLVETVKGYATHEKETLENVIKARNSAISNSGTPAQQAESENMLSGALRSAGDARTPMVLGIAMTVLNLVLNLVLIRGLGPIPAFGTVGSAMGTVIASGLVAIYALWKLWGGGWVVQFPRGQGFAPDWTVIRSLFRFGLPTGVQGIAMNVGGVLMLSFIGALAQSAAAQAAFAVSYSQLFSLITWTSVGLMGAAAAVAGQNLGAGQPDRAEAAVHTAARFGLVGAAVIGACFFFFPRQLLAVFGMNEPNVVEIGAQLLRVLSVSGLFVTVALTYTGGLQGTGDTRSPLYISIVSQVAVPLGICFVIQQTGTLEPIHVWLAILAGHVTRCVLSVVRFNQGGWRSIAVDLDGRRRKA